MVTIKNITFTYKRKPVFNGLSLNFKEGHVYGLLGKNGTGKSTLLHNIAGLLYPQSGSITVNTYTPGDRLPVFLQDVFMIPEEFHLPDISVPDFIKHYVPFYNGFNRENFNSYLETFKIPLDSTLNKMSYGQKKKVLISFALASNARLVLMDEPTNGLDIISKSQFRKILAQALNDDRCFIISTHQVKDLENLIDRVTIIDEGKILFDETLDDISHKLTFRFAFEDSELTNAIYSESSLAGNVLIAPNTDGEESKIDLELLYKAIVTNPDRITKLFQS